MRNCVMKLIWNRDKNANARIIGRNNNNNNNSNGNTNNNSDIVEIKIDFRRFGLRGRGG